MARGNKPEFGSPKEYDPNFKGPVSERSCTDVICCIIFAIGILGAAVCSVMGYVQGDPPRLFYPTDSAGSLCGQGKHKNKSHLFFFDLMQCAKMATGVVGCPTPQICVSKCPEENFEYLESIALEKTGQRQKAREKLICKYAVNPLRSNESIENLVKKEMCASNYVASKSVFSLCIPVVKDQPETHDEDRNPDPMSDEEDDEGVAGSGTETANDSQTVFRNNNTGTQFLDEFYRLKRKGHVSVKDLWESWPHIIFGLLIAMVLSLLLTLFLRFFLETVVWVTLGLLAGLLVLWSYSSYRIYYDLKGKPPTNNLDMSKYNMTDKDVWLASGCTSATLLVIFLLIIIFIVRNIRAAIELIKEGNRAMMTVLFWPLLPFVLQLGVILYCVTSDIYIESMVEKVYYEENGIKCNPDDTTFRGLCKFVRYISTPYSRPMAIYVVFMSFWLMNFIMALGQMTLAGAFATFYWSRNDMPPHPLLSSFGRCLRYHLGSLALGSLIIPILQLIRLVLEYIYIYAQTTGINKTFLKRLKRCLQCPEKISKYINRNAYTVIAIYGHSFFPASKESFQLIMRNIKRIYKFDKVSAFIILTGKLMVTCGVALIFYNWFQHRIPVFEDLVPDLNSCIIPVIFLSLGTYMVACCFLSVFDMAVDTLFLCFLEDLERNDGTPERPYKMNSGMKKILRKDRNQDGMQLQCTQLQSRVTVPSYDIDPGSEVFALKEQTAWRALQPNLQDSVHR